MIHTNTDTDTDNAIPIPIPILGIGGTLVLLDSDSKADLRKYSKPTGWRIS